MVGCGKYRITVKGAKQYCDLFAERKPIPSDVGEGIAYTDEDGVEWVTGDSTRNYRENAGKRSLSARVTTFNGAVCGARHYYVEVGVDISLLRNIGNGHIVYRFDPKAPDECNGFSIQIDHAVTEEMARKDPDRFGPGARYQAGDYTNAYHTKDEVKEALQWLKDTFFPDEGWTLVWE